MRVLVTGSRDWGRPDLIWDDLDGLLRLHGTPFVVVRGDAKGADTTAGSWARERRRRGYAVVEEAHPADWERFGRGAGIQRNLAMVRAGADLCLAYILNDSRGASHCANAAESAGIRTWRCALHTSDESLARALARGAR